MESWRDLRYGKTFRPVYGIGARPASREISIITDQESQELLGDRRVDHMLTYIRWIIVHLSIFT